MRVLVTRAAHRAAATARGLRAAGHEPLLLPLQTVERLHGPPPAVDATCCAATSAEALEPLPADGRRLLGLPLYAVGRSTAAAGRAAGFANVNEASGDARSLAEALLQAGGGPVLYLAGEPRRPDLEQALQAGGRPVAIWLRYRVTARTVLSEAECAALTAAPIDAVLHFSQESAVRLQQALAGAGLAGLLDGALHVAISADLAAGARALFAPRRPVLAAAEPSAEALIAALQRGETKRWHPG